MDWRRLIDARATTTLLVVALTLTLLHWKGSRLDVLVADPVTWRTEPWRLVTSTLLHANFLHLAFNLYWVAVFGTLVESSYGLARTIVLYLFLAVASSAPQVALSGPGIGLSGIGYGLFGFVWALSRFDHRHRGILDPRTTTSFVVWFFVCIAASAGGVLPIANIAHAAGACAGAAAGWLASDRTSSVLARGLPLFLVLVAIGLACTVFQTRLADAGMSSYLLEQQVREAIERGEGARAEALLRQRIAAGDATWRTYWALGTALWQQGDTVGARRALEQAERMTTLPPECSEYLRELREHEHE